MSAVHLLRSGVWGVCLSPTSCEEACHLSDVTLEAAGLMPPHVLEGLFSAFDPPTRVSKWGRAIWHDADSKLHRDFDLPAVVLEDGARSWYQHGLEHRDFDRPAVVPSSSDLYGRFYWYQNGLIHRDGGRPAMVAASGDEYWYDRGQQHRDYDLPAVVLHDGSKHWYQQGVMHREADLPAVLNADGSARWYQRGKLHREHGPALMNADGSTEWWVRGTRVKRAFG